MRYINQLAVILLFWAAGELLGQWIAPIIRFPGTVLGMVLLFLALVLGWVKEEAVQDTAEFFLSNIGFFFVPIVVSLMTVRGFTAGLLMQVTAVSVVTTVLTLGAVAVVVERMIRGRAVDR